MARKTLNMLRSEQKMLIKKKLKQVEKRARLDERKKIQREVNQLKREVEKCNKFLLKPMQIPIFPKSGRLTKKLKELFDKFGIDPRFYTKGVK